MQAKVLVLRPSASEAWINCSLSPHASEGVADTAGEPAREGTRVHHLIEHCLKNGECASDCYLGATFDVPGLGPFVVTDEHVKNSGVMLRYVADLLAKDKAAELYSELRVTAVEATAEVPRVVIGTTDCAVLLPTLRELHIVDYKNGYGIVEPVAPQLGCYTEGVLKRFHNREFDTIVKTIVQPRAGHVDGPIRSVTMDRLDAYDFRVELEDAVKATMNPVAKVGPWCDKCKGAQNCPALRAFADEHKVNPFGEIVHPTKGIQDVKAITDPAEIGQRLAGVKALEAYIKSVEARAFEMAVGGTRPVGYKLVAGREGNRKWKSDPDAVINSVYLRTGVDITERSALSPTQAHKALGAEGYKLVEDLIERPAGRPTLAPDEDHPTLKADARPAISVDRSAVFDTIEHRE